MTPAYVDSTLLFTPTRFRAVEIEATIFSHSPIRGLRCLLDRGGSHGGLSSFPNPLTSWLSFCSGTSTVLCHRGRCLMSGEVIDFVFSEFEVCLLWHEGWM